MNCYGDFEYTMGFPGQAGDTEIISCGLIATNKRFEIVDRIYIEIRPTFLKRVTRDCTELTGLTRERLIDSGISSNEAAKRMIGFINKNNCKKIRVYGNGDAEALRKNAVVHERDRFSTCQLADITLDIAGEMAGKIKEIVMKGSGERIQTRGLGVKHLCMAANVEYSEEKAHNSLYDAERLLEIEKSITTGGCDSDSVKKAVADHDRQIAELAHERACKNKKEIEYMIKKLRRKDISDLLYMLNQMSEERIGVANKILSEFMKGATNEQR